MFKAHRLLYRSTLGLRVMKKKKRRRRGVTRAGEKRCEARQGSAHTGYATSANRLWPVREENMFEPQHL